MHWLYKIALLSTLWLTFLGEGQAQPASSPRRAVAKVAAPPATPANALLWKVSGKGLAKPSYLYGTIHLICPQDLRISEPVKRAFASTRQLILELDMDSPTLLEDMKAGMKMNDGQTLHKLLSAADYARVSSYLKDKAGIPIAQVSMLKPFIVSSLLYSNLLGCAPASYETSFVKLAQEQHKEIQGLETVQEQLGFFDKIPYTVQSQLLADLVTREAEAQQEFQQLVTLYKAQKIEELRAVTSASAFSFPGYAEMLLDNRNQRWLATIAQQAAGQPTFFAVGAAHLGGPKGLLALLRQQGYQVQPVTR
ncbi:TraB/GumN family protein [Hymenobacter sp. 5516J-16]|uniref:TraB/GumN family protein n=1 Tax=Hymenobacter sp. 5516J-16 TaxID=2932253 RepID=UPI001FD073B1|nr:TraB/GumN family protein [Hymenobacter sp. 5516J-16]UOQ78587.1 TraB/GumN family protein [Hymenobacter sp. 5516J-16]